MARRSRRRVTRRRSNRRKSVARRRAPRSASMLVKPRRSGLRRVAGDRL